MLWWVVEGVGRGVPGEERVWNDGGGELGMLWMEGAWWEWEEADGVYEAMELGTPEL